MKLEVVQAGTGLGTWWKYGWRAVVEVIREQGLDQRGKGQIFKKDLLGHGEKIGLYYHIAG